MREIRMDIAKGIGVFLVMIHHMPSLMPDVVHAWVGGFDMALFFFITGYFIKPQDTWGGVFSKIRSKFKSIIIPYVIYAVLFSFIYLCAGENVGEFLDRLKGMLLGGGGYYMLWFLFSLFITEVIMYVILKLRSNKILTISIVAVALLCGFILGKLEINVFKIGTSLYMLGFVYVGYICKEYKLLDRLERGYITLAAAILNIAGSIAIFSIAGVVMDAMPNQEYDILCNYVVALSGILVTINVSKLIKNAVLLGNGLAYVGKNSLYFYPLVGFIPDITTFALSDSTIAKIVSRVVALPVTWIIVEFKNRVVKREQKALN